MDDFHPNAEIRKACNEVSTEFQKFGIDQNMRRDVFAKFKHYYENQYQTEKQTLSSERVKYIEDAWKQYLMDGLNLNDVQFEQVKEMKKESAEMSNKFSFNLTNENTSFEFSLEQLDGMQEDWLKTRLQENGLYKVTLKYPDYLPLMEYCKVRETRKTMSRAFNSRCGVENAPLCERTYKLRHELAEIFGYDSYANYSLQKKMAKNYDNVMNFLNSLKDNIQPVLTNDYNQLYTLANLDGITQFEIYDMAYYMRLYKEQQTSLDPESLRQYFSLDTVIAGTFEIYQRFLSVKFTDITADHVDELWHETVQLFQVNDSRSGELMGYFYLDLYPRLGKYGHAAVFPFIRKSSRTLPICTMACNFTKERGLTHSEVVTFFHEFGHVMHNVCSDVELLFFGGTQTSRDYVECPSQCFENWCYALEPLQILSGGSIPEDVVDKINKQNKLCQGYHYSRQLVFSLVDMYIHSTRWSELPNDVYNSTMREVLRLEPIEGMRFMETFNHLMGGYQAGYYGYMWSEVFSSDIYVTCIKGHELDPEIGLKYRKEILSYGGSRDEMDGLVNMLNRFPNDKAFIESIIG
jgi:Zn-dependent oligopeptidase